MAVPAISWRPGTDLVQGGVARGKALQDEYTAKRYHQPDDEYDPNWNFQGQVRDWQLLHNVGYRLANGNEWPNWSRDSEFRSTRDQTAGERGSAAPPPAPAPAPGERG